MTERRGIIIGATGILALTVGVLSLTISPSAPAQTAAVPNLPVVDTVSVTGYQLLSERRISRTVYDLTYLVTVRNFGSALIVVSGRASTAATNVTFPDNTASFGDIAANTPANSTDTIVIRHDRTQPFTTNQLTWQFTAAPGDGIPPDPGPANDLTLEGIDSDNDGVRDDVERWISTSYPEAPRARAALAQRAVVIQQELTYAQLSLDPYAVALAGQRAITCLRYLFEDAATSLRRSLEGQVLNTSERLRASFAFSDQLAGRGFQEIPEAQRAATCSFDPTQLANQQP